MTTLTAWRLPYDFNAARPTFVDAWPQPWRALAPESEMVDLSFVEMNALGWQIAGFRHWFLPAPATMLLDLAYRLDAAIERQGRASFVRLTSRSPKDSLYAQRRGLRVYDGAQALAMITEGSKRCAADLRMALDCQSALAMVVRKWIDFPPYAEFRCFMVDRKWVGASQMGGIEIDGVPWTREQAQAVVGALQASMKQVTATSHIVDAAVDLACLPFANGRAVSWRATLLDVNPLTEVTDLGLFAPTGKFDLTVRFRRLVDEGRRSIPLSGSSLAGL